MEDVKKTYREGEEKTKEAWRGVDGTDAKDEIGNVGDDIREGLGNAGDDIREGLGNAGDEMRRKNPDRVEDTADRASWEAERTVEDDRV